MVSARGAWTLKKYAAWDGGRNDGDSSIWIQYTGSLEIVLKDGMFWGMFVQLGLFLYILISTIFICLMVNSQKFLLKLLILHIGRQF
jgi:hypothetical protein